MITTVSVICLCGKNSETLQLDSQLPVPVSPCSCDSCRYSTGVLYFSCLPLVSRPNILHGLAQYGSSSKLDRYFCPACGSPMFVHVHKTDTWSVCSGVVDNVMAFGTTSVLSLEKIVQYEFVGDTKDGGLAICLAQVDGRAIPFYLQGPDGPKVKGTTGGFFARTEDNGSAARRVEVDRIPMPFEDSSELRAGCHCGGVDFRITRPNALSKKCSSPWPDLLVPYHSSSSENRGDVKWWLRANDSKYLAGTCACRSCRLGSGSPIQAWAFIPKANIFQLDGKPLEYNTGTLKRVESSKGCFREFCSGCGATVFWHCLERPDLVDVSVGLLRASEGSRAMTWLDWWTERVSFREEAIDKMLIDNLEKGLRAIELANG